jgi:hypothetical protein
MAFAILGWFGIPHETHYKLGKYLSKKGEVYFGIVRFFKDDKEVITKSRPLYGYERKEIIEEWGFHTFFWDFHNPYIKYFFPKYALEMKENIVSKLPKDTIFVTRSPYAKIVLKDFLKLKVQYSARTGLSGSKLREKIYSMQDLEKELMPQTARVIEKVNGRIKKFAKEKDRTIKLFGFKIPIEGFLI